MYSACRPTIQKIRMTGPTPKPLAGKADVSSLRDLLDERELLTTASDIAGFTTDLLHSAVELPLAVARPASTQSVARIVSWCRDNEIAIVPQGGLTGLCAGAVPSGLPGAVILSLGRMNAVKNIDLTGNTITVEAGAVLANVKALAEGKGRYLPLSHGAEGSSQIGGNLSTDSGGNNALRYGTARDQVLGLEVVLPDGNIWNGLRRLRKNTAGYDLKHLFLGAEGTLGIITAAVLELQMAPANRQTALFSVPDAGSAISMLHQLRAIAGETVAAFELISAAAMERALEMPGSRYPMKQNHNWFVLAELESSGSGIDLQSLLEEGLGLGFEAGWVAEAVISKSGAQRLGLWKLREAVAEGCIEDISCLKSDTAVPVDCISAYLEAAGLAVEKILPGARPLPFGHLGDGNIHYNVRRPPQMDHEMFRTSWPELTAAIEAEAIKLGGTISAEHGLGRLKSGRYGTVADAVELDLMYRLKNCLDPGGLMNPGIYSESG